jgi:hypothetical protein
MPLSERAQKARRLNAQKSTGPRSRAGKARVAQNALAHGLSRPYRKMPQGPKDIEELAKALLVSLDFSEEQFLGDSLLWGAACRFAEAHLDLDRIQAAREERLKAEIVKTIIPTRKQQAKIFEAGNRIKDDEEAAYYVEENLRIITIRSNPERGEKHKLLAKVLDPLDRYERRTFSKMKKALEFVARKIPIDQMS